MSKLFIDVLGNMALVKGYQIEDSIAKRYFLQPGYISPWTRLRVESLAQVHKAKEGRKHSKHYA